MTSQSLYEIVKYKAAKGDKDKGYLNPVKGVKELRRSALKSGLQEVQMPFAIM